MKKKILPLLLSLTMLCQPVMTAYGMKSDHSLLKDSSADISIQATDLSGGDAIEESEYAVDTKDLTVETSSNELITISTTVPLLQNGALGNSDFTQYNDLPLYTASEYAWEDALVERIVDALESYEQTIDVSSLNIPYTDETWDAVNEIYQNLLNSNSYFYASGGMSASLSDIFYSLTLRYSGSYYNADGTLNTAAIEADRLAYDSRVAYMLSHAKAEMSDLEKALAIHDVLVRECDYDYINYLNNTLPEASFSAYGALVNGVSVCQGYALAYMDLLKHLDIPCVVVSSYSMNHAWNMVYLDGSWFHVDATWNDPVIQNNDYTIEGRVGHQYFLASDSEITMLSHSGWNSDAPVASTNGAYSGYCFRDNEHAMNYYNGKWYYLSAGYSDNYIQCSKIDGSEMNTILPDRRFSFLHGINEKMYLADSNGVYSATAPDFSDLQTCKISTQDAAYQGYNLTEFAIKNGMLVAVLYNGSAYNRVVVSPTDTETVASYSVIFRSNSSTVVPSLGNVASGSLIERPADPDKTGYRFLGWYKDAALTQAWNFSTDTVTRDTILYGKWGKIIAPPAFQVKGVFGGRDVTMTSATEGVEIYYSTTTSRLTTNDLKVGNGETVTFNSYYGTIYARAYCDGQWSNPARLILKIPTVNTPTITQSGTRVTVKTTTPKCYIYYTTDGSTPSLTNGTKIAASAGSFNVAPDTTVRAIAVRSCFSNSAVASKRISVVDPNIGVPSFAVVGVIGGRTVTFNSTTPDTRIYYSTSSTMTTQDASVVNGGSVTFNDFYGTIYARTYSNGRWSNVARLILKIPVVNTPTITRSGDYVTIKTTTPRSAIYYTTDGSTPSPTNGRRINASAGRVSIPSGSTIKAIAVRSCFGNSSVATGQ